MIVIFFFFKQKTAYEMRISDWSSDVCSSDLTPELLDQALLALREAGHARPAVITSNAVVTLRVGEAGARRGWRLGVDVGWVSIDDTPWAPYVGPGISAVSQPTGELGRLAAQCLMQRLAGSNVAARKILLPGTLMARGSTRR